MTMTFTPHGVRRVFTPDEADARLVGIEKGQQLAGHFPSDVALDRARRILIGELTPDEARAEIIATYSE
jgi:hypothetical protein